MDDRVSHSGQGLGRGGSEVRAWEWGRGEGGRPGRAVGRGGIPEGLRAERG